MTEQDPPGHPASTGQAEGWGPPPAPHDPWAAPVLSAPPHQPAPHQPAPHQAPHQPLAPEPLYEFGAEHTAPSGYAAPPPHAYAPPAAYPPAGYPPAWGWSQDAPGYGAPPGRSRPSGGLLAGVVGIALLVGGIAGGAAGFLAGREDISFGSSVKLDDTTTPAVTRPPDSVAGIAARVLPGVVKIEVRGGGALGTGTGFVIDKVGYIVTNSHVVGAGGKASKIRVQFNDKQTVNATLVGQDPSSDLAVLRVRGVKGLKPLQFGDSDGVAVGDPVLAVGTPLGLAGSVTAGIISARNRAVTAGGPGEEPTYINALQTDTAINPGNSGGPLVSGRGEVIGVTSAIASLAGSSTIFGGQSGSIGVGFAIPANLARRAIEQLIATGEAVHPVIGATLDPGFAGEGAKIVPRTTAGTAPIVKGGPADKAGLKAGDLVVAIDGVRVMSADELIVAIRTHEPGETVKLTVRREGKEHTYAVVLGKATK